MRQLRDLSGFFEPKSIAVIGASRNPSKVGHVVFKNLIEGGYKGKLYAINPNTESLLNHTVYGSVKNIKEKVDLAVIAVPAEIVLPIVKECNSVGIKNLLILTAGFSETGNKEGEDALREYIQKNKMKCVGVNCLGIYNAHSSVDAMFIPRYRLKRPMAGGIGFACQSGAIGAAILDIATERNHKFSRFVSYGNATDIDESDILHYLGNDDKTKVICLYLEGIKDGEKFYETVRAVSKKKPIVAIKGGLTAKGSEAALSHTGSLAGAREVYEGVFRQAGVIQADSLEEMFDIASVVEKGLAFKGNRIQIITNGGGYGIMSTDLIADSKHLTMSELAKETYSVLRKSFPERVNVHNPLDLVGDATTERYKIALEACIRDKNVDAILLIVLYQTPLITTDIVEVISEMHQETKKPILVVSTGGEFTEALSKALEDEGLPTFSFPKNAICAMDKLVWYYQHKQR